MSTEMLSRIADSLFWLARYMERAEDTARILDVNYHMLLEQSAVPYRLRWDPLIIMAGEQERFKQFYKEANAQTVYEFLAFPIRSCSASPRPGRMHAPFATASRARCGKTLMACTTR